MAFFSIVLAARPFTSLYYKVLAVNDALIIIFNKWLACGVHVKPSSGKHYLVMTNTQLMMSDNLADSAIGVVLSGVA